MCDDANDPWFGQTQYRVRVVREDGCVEFTGTYNDREAAYRAGARMRHGVRAYHGGYGNDWSMQERRLPPLR